jgi:hypothetical protein
VNEAWAILLWRRYWLDVASDTSSTKTLVRKVGIRSCEEITSSAACRNVEAQEVFNGLQVKSFDSFSQTALSSHGFTGRRQPFLSEFSLHVAKSPSGEPALELVSLVAEAQPYVQHVAVQRRVMIFLGFLKLLLTVPNLVLFLVISFLVTVRFSLSQQVPRRERLPHHVREG